MEVKVKSKSKDGLVFDKVRVHHEGTIILREVSGTLVEGSMTAIMGASGSGKSTLLDALAGRRQISGGNITWKGEEMTPQSLQLISAMVEQEEALLSTQTVYESIYFSARMRLSADESALHKQQATTNILGKLNLLGKSDERISRLSGGEKKRVSIGIEMVTNPSLLILDEPTSGLDSSTAYKVIEQLRNYAKDEGCTILCSLHSPSSKVLQCFDSILLLHDGHIITQGSLQECSNFFHSYYTDRWALHTNPAEYFLATLQKHGPPSFSALTSTVSSTLALTIDSNTKSISDSNSCANPGTIPDLTTDLATDSNADTISKCVIKSNYKSPIKSNYESKIKSRPQKIGRCEEMWLLTERAGKHSCRERFYNLIRVMECVVLALFIGYLYWQCGASQRSVYARVGYIFFTINMQALLSVINAVLTFGEERVMYRREKSTKIYHTSSYFFAKTVIDFPVQLLLTILYGSIGYWMVLSRLDVVVFMRFILCLLVMGNTTQSIGLILAAGVPNASVAMVLCPLTLVPSMLLSGFFIVVEDIPVWISWLSYLSPHRYIFEALMTNEFDTLTFYCEPEERVNISGYDICPINSGKIVLETFGMKISNFWFDIAICTALFIGFRFIAYLTLRYTRGGAIRSKLS